VKKGKDRERPGKRDKKREKGGLPTAKERRNTKKREKKGKKRKAKGRKGKKKNLCICFLNKIFLVMPLPKNYAFIRQKTSFWETSFPRPPTGALPLDPTWGLPSPRPPHFTPPNLKS